MNLRKNIKTFFGETDGTTTVEYCVMLSLILLVVLIGITATGSGVKDWWNNIDSELSTNGF